MGGEISASAGDESISVTVTGLASGTPKIVEVLADVARAAAFPAAEVELAKTNALQGLAVRESTPEFLAQKAFAKAVYGDHPYHVTAPSRDTLSAATPALLKAEYQRRLPAGRRAARRGRRGRCGRDAVRRDAFLLAWGATGSGPPRRRPARLAGVRKLLIVNRPGSVQSQILMGRPTPTLSDPDYFPLVVANTICAGSFGSRLVENIREDKGYTYSPGGSLQALPKGGLMTVQADVRNDVTGASLLEMFYELDRMGATNPSDEELQRAKRYQSGLYLIRNQIQGSVRAHAREQLAQWPAARRRSASSCRR